MYYVIIVGYLFLLAIAIYVVYVLAHAVCRKLVKMIRKKKFKWDFLFACVGGVLLCIVIFFSMIAVSDKFLAYSKEKKEENPVTEILEIVLNEEDYKIDPWNNKNIEREQGTTYIDDLFHKKLHFSNGSKLIKNYNGEKLVEEYGFLLNDWIKYRGDLSLKLLFSELKFYTGNEIRSIEDIDRDIKKYKPNEVPIDIYIEEFYARICIALENGSKENVYQIARVADDIVYILEENPESIYMFMFFATCSIEFYLESLTYDDITETRADIYLKCGVILEKIKRQLNTIEAGDCITDEQDKHLQLLMNAFYDKAYVEMTIEDNWCQAYLAYYYGINLYDVGKVCGISDVNHYEKSLKFLSEYLKKNDRNVENINSCKSYISRIMSEYEELQVYEE